MELRRLKLLLLALAGSSGTVMRRLELRRLELLLLAAVELALLLQLELLLALPLLLQLELRRLELLLLALALAGSGSVLRRLELRRLKVLLLALPLMQLELQLVGNIAAEPATWQPRWELMLLAAVAATGNTVALMQHLELLSERRRLDLRNTVARQWLR